MPKKVLLVDDSATSRLMHRLIVAKNTNYTVICAQDGDQALKLASSERPDLILMDIMMPGVNGNRALSHVGPASGTGIAP